MSWIDLSYWLMDLSFLAPGFPMVRDLICLVWYSTKEYASPPCQDISAAHCVGIDPNRNVQNLYFPHIQEIPFECLKKGQLPNRLQLACICTGETQRPLSKVIEKTRKSLDWNVSEQGHCVQISQYLCLKYTELSTHDLEMNWMGWLAIEIRSTDRIPAVLCDEHVDNCSEEWVWDVLSKLAMA